MPTTCYINGRFLTQRVTGVQRYSRELLLALDRLLGDEQAPSERFVLLTPPGADAFPLEHVEVRQVGRLRGHLWEQVSLARASRGGLLVGFSATGPAVRAHQVVTVHDASVHAAPDGFSWAFRTWYRWLIGWLGRRVRLVVTVSAFSKGELATHFGIDPGRIRVATEGHEHILRLPPDPTLLRSVELRTGRYVLAVSSHAPNKNFRLIVDAIGLLGEPTFDVVIVGGDDTRVFGDSPLPDLPHVHLVGYVGDAQLRALYEGAELFIFPSVYEGFGLPPLEAMACGCPVVASDAASLPEVCGDAAAYIPPHDARRLADVVTALLDDPGRLAELRSAGLARAAGFTWEAAARRNLELVREAAGLPDRQGRTAAS